MMSGAAQQQRQFLSPVEEETFLSSLGKGGLSGLAMVGNVLDTPGAFIRDSLAGENPFLNIFNPSERTTGRELARDYGLIGRQNNWGNFAGGFAAEVALDPLTWLSGGASALAKGGQVAKRAGLLGDVAKASGKGARVGRMTTNLDDLIKHVGGDAAERAANAAQAMGLNMADIGGDKLGGLFGIRKTPFSDPTRAFGTGPIPQAIAGKLDKAGHAIAYGKYSPVARLRPLLDHRVQGAGGEQGMKLGERLTDGREAAAASARGQFAEPLAALDKSGVFDKQVNQNYLEDSFAISDYMEGISKELPESMQGISPHIQSIRELIRNVAPEELAEGLGQRELDDLIDYFPRQKVFFDGGRSRGSSAKWADTTHPHMRGRKDPLKGVPGGTSALQRMSLDPVISGFAHGLKGRKINLAELKQLRQHVDSTYVQNGLLPVSDRSDSYDPLIRWLADLDPRHASTKTPVFETNPLTAAMARVDHSKKAIETSKAIQGFLVEHGGVAGDVPLSQVLTNAKLDSKVVGPKILGHLMKNADVQGLVSGMSGAKLSDVLKAVHVPQDIAENIGRVMKTFTQPEEIGGLLSAVDQFNNFFKSGVTSLWPAFHVRNGMSGQIQNYFGGAYDPTRSGPMRYIQPLRDTHAITTGKSIDGAAKIPGLSGRGLSDAAATRELANEAFSHQILGGHQGQALDVAGDSIDGLAGELAGLRNHSLKDIAQAAIPRNLGKSLDEINPWKVRGAGANKNTFSPARAGEMMGAKVETYNRLAPFIAFRKQGYSAAEAAKKVKLLQVDYSALSVTERRVMKRLFPFYSFSRGTAKYVTKELFENPGGKMAQSIRATTKGHESTGTTPDYIASTTSIPMGKKSDGSDSYITGLGLMHEDTMQFLDGPKQAGLEVLSRLNPLLKGTLEGITGQSFFMRGPQGGRSLDDLDPTLGRAASNFLGRDKPVTFPGSRLAEALVANSPASRAASTVRTLSDPRKENWEKALNLLSGVKKTDVSPAQQEAILDEMRQAKMKSLGARAFENVYFRKDELEQMPPAQRQEAEQLQTIMKVLTRRAKERAASR
jgi:hypothetical protein